MEAAFLLQLLGRQWGTNNIHNCSYYCHQASGVGLTQSLGSGTSTVNLQDLKYADLVIIAGANPACNHPRFMTRLVELRRRGGRIIVINPVKELGLQRFSLPKDMGSLLFSSEIANLYIQPHSGGDSALFKAAALYLWQEKKVDFEFLETRCSNLEAFVKDLTSEKIESLIAKSGITYRELTEFCHDITQSRNTIMAWSLGITQHTHGVSTVCAISNLALIRGMIGKPGAGLLPLRGHSNVQGVGTVGVMPKLKPAIAEAMLKNLKVPLHSQPGKDTFGSMEAAYRGEIDFSLMLGGNLYGSSPDQRRAAKALGHIDKTVFMSTSLNLGHIHGHGKNTLILPVRTRDEERQSTSQESMFSFVRLSSGGSLPAETKLPSETDIFVHAGTELFGNSPLPWPEFSDHGKIRRFIGDTVPGMRELSEIESLGEFTIPGRIKHSPVFNTADGKAALAVIKPVDANPEPGFFNLMTVRSEGQFNTIVYDNSDIYRGTEHRRVVLLNRKDIISCGFTEGDSLWVESEIGRMRVELVEGDIRERNVLMYFPEANAIVPGKVDPQSKTPSFKRIKVRIYIFKKK